MKNKPVLAITMGDPAGIGPEIVLKALKNEEIYQISCPLVIGDQRIIEESLKTLGISFKLNPIKEIADIKCEPGTIDLLDLHNIHPSEVSIGRICKSCGKAAVEYVLKACEMAMSGEVDALVTAPINKESTTLAGFGELGHMELLAKYTGTREYATMLVSGTLRVVHLTTHYSLKNALDQVVRERIFNRLKLIHNSFVGWGIQKPTIAVAALNPHAGEGGILGDEEIREIAPAIKDARECDIDARGPFPADTVFNRAIKGEFDVVLAMYHDQGHIAVKVYGFENSISVALGLPFIRTSVDHGTAFDIAGKGIASAESMIEAVKMAAKLSKSKRL
ncbi:MAG: 4-hydroxythreonine-4-phosphate dehydrogenase PdxA [Dehalococcoidales bacterium]|jgi:4-hydroxythreonine-4-phosphate dehydrogenase|nr:4-hydroxythreonine-4-phosphate dehydrogenase PdxA [Dehalococcoidales bacterium]